MKLHTIRFLFSFFQLVSHGHSNEQFGWEAVPAEESFLGDLLNQFPSCEIWILNDSGIGIEILQSIFTMAQPVYFISLREPNVSYPEMKNPKRFSQGDCSIIMIFCQSQEMCQGIPGLSNHLSGIGKVLLFRRQILLFLEKEVATKHDAFFSKINQGPTLMNEINSTFALLGAHITVVRKWIDPIGRYPSGEAYHLITWTPNWFPGGTPVLFDTWIKSDGFHFGNQLNINANHIKPNTTFRVCVPTFRVRPIFQPNPHDPLGIGGTQTAFFKYFAEKLRLKVSIHEARERDYGKPLPNGDWTGALGCVIRKEADIAAGHLIFNAQRRNADLLFGPWDSILSGAVVCSAPAPIPLALRLFLPLQPDVWAYIISTFLVTLLFAKLGERFIRRFLKPILIWSDDWYAPPKVKKEEVEWHYVLAPLLSDPIPNRILPRRTGYLILLGSWLIVSYLITIFFSCGLVGFLLSIPKEPPISSLVDLVERNEDPWFITNLVHETIANSVYHIEQHLIKFQKNLEPLSPDPSRDLEIEGYLYLRDTIDTCLVGEEVRSKYYLPLFLTQGGVHGLGVAEIPFFLGPTGWFLRSDMDFTLQIFIFKFVSTYRSTGLFAKHLQDVINGIPDYEDYEVLINPPDSHPLNFSHLEIVFLAYVVSLTVAGVVFLLEIFWAYRAKNQKGTNGSRSWDERISD